MSQFGTLDSLLQRQASTHSISLGGGMDTKTDAKNLAPGRLALAQNVVSRNAQKASKRFGQTPLTKALASGGTLTSAQALLTRQTEILLTDGAQLYTYGDSGNAWLPRGSLTPTNITVSPVVQNQASRSGVTSVCTANVELVVWQDSRGGIRYSLRDVASQAFYVSDTLLDAGGAHPRCLAINGFVYCFYTRGTEVHALKWLELNPTAAPQAYSISADFATGAQYFFAAEAAAPLGGVWVTYSTGTTSYIVRFLRFSDLAPLGVFVPPAGNDIQLTGIGSATTTPQGFLATFFTEASGDFCVNRFVYSAGTITNPARGFPQSPGLSSPAATVGIVCTAESAAGVSPYTATYTLVYSTPANAHTTGVNEFVSAAQLLENDSTGFVRPTAFPSGYGLQAVSKPFLLNGSPYFVAASPTFNNGILSATTAYFLVDQNAHIVSRFLGESAFASSGLLSQVSVLGAEAKTALCYRLQLSTGPSGAVYATTGATMATIQGATGAPSAEMANVALIAAGSTFVYDGASLVESGFYQYPENVTATANAAGSGFMSQGIVIPTAQYFYIATYEWTDTQGNVHRSTPSFICNQGAGVAVPQAGSVTLTVPTTALTRRTGAAGEVAICIYRTIANSSGPYFLVGTVTNAGAFSGQATISVTDTAPDLAIQGNVELYAPPDGSGEVENTAPPTFKSVVATKNRIWGIPQEMPNVLWYSKPFTPGRPPEFSDAFTLSIEGEGGFTTALGSLHDNLAVFKTAHSYVVYGAGPDSSGQNGGFDFPQLVSRSTGCVNQASVITADPGCFFQSARGIELLDFGGNINAVVGAPMYAYKDAPITGAVLVPDQSHVRFTTSTDTALVYDYFMGQWSVFANYSSVGAAFWKNQGFARADASGTVWVEDETTFLDGGVAVPMVLETGWIHPQGLLQAFQRIRRFAILGDYASPHRLSIDIAYDYNDYSHTITWDPVRGVSLTTYGQGTPYGVGDAVYGGSAYGTQYQVRVRLPVQKCQAVRFRVYDSSISGESCRLNAIELELTPKAGLGRLPAGQTK